MDVGEFLQTIDGADVWMIERREETISYGPKRRPAKDM